MSNRLTYRGTAGLMKWIKENRWSLINIDWLSYTSNFLHNFKSTSFLLFISPFSVPLQFESSSSSSTRELDYVDGIANGSFATSRHLDAWTTQLMNPFSLHSAVLNLDCDGNPPPCIPYCNRYLIYLLQQVPYLSYYNRYLTCSCKRYLPYLL